ncbi:MAG TPA: ATP-binding protein [Pilimelia sp.]|nr:ATP-binding protein [Pilimelia sp.]
MLGVLRRTPLRVKLVASVLTLVTLALVVISAGSAVALRSYLVDRVDERLAGFAAGAANVVTYGLGREVALPTDFYGRRTTVEGVGDPPTHDPRLAPADLPPDVTGLARLREREGVIHTVRSHNGNIRWRVLVTVLPNGGVLHLGYNMTDVEQAVRRLVWIDILVGGAVLTVLAALGATIVRSSLRPLVEIERTAAAIAAGDLSRRVPDPERADDEPPQAAPATELGRLSWALNAMLAQIETAFAARAASEAAARSAEYAARDAAVAAQDSEARARRSEVRMRQFVADASHELRTPLTTIRGFAELYRQGAVASPAEGARVVRRIEDEAARMGLLVEDLLLLARLDHERPLALAPVELPVLAMDAVQAARVMAPDRKIELDLPVDAGPLVVHGDDARLRQVLGNLMTNALTHTPPGSAVTVRLGTRPGEPAVSAGPGDPAVSGLAVVEVVDTGPGLSPDQRERVFERFYRADAARTRRAEGATGTGLGLAIVAAIVAAHQGRVEVAGEAGRGAVFRVLLPLLPEPPPPAVAAGPSVDPAEASR